MNKCPLYSLINYLPSMDFSVYFEYQVLHIEFPMVNDTILNIVYWKDLDQTFEINRLFVLCYRFDWDKFWFLTENSINGFSDLFVRLFLDLRSCSISKCIIRLWQFFCISPNNFLLIAASCLLFFFNHCRFPFKLSTTIHAKAKK